MELKERIIAYIINHNPITYTAIENVALGKGFTQLEVMEAMERVHKDKRITQTTRGEEIVYRPYIAPPVKEPFKSTVPYPRPGENGIPEFVMPFPEWDLSFIFLTPEELDKYKADLRGVKYIRKKRYAHNI